MKPPVPLPATADLFARLRSAATPRPTGTPSRLSAAQVADLNAAPREADEWDSLREGAYFQGIAGLPAGTTC